MQDAIYRDKVLHARAMTKEERIEEVFAQSRLQMQMMLAGAMKKIGTSNESAGWREVGKWMEKLDRARDAQFYSSERRESGVS